MAPDFDEEVKQQLSDLGATPQPISLQRTGLNPIKDFGTILQFRRIFRNLSPDIVLSYTVKPVIYGSIAARFASVPTKVALVTGLGFTFSEGQGAKGSLIQRAIKLLYRFGLSCADKVIFQNPDDRQLLESQGLVAAEKTGLVNGSGVNLEYFSRMPYPDTQTLKFLMIGRLNREKGVREYVDAAKKLKQEFPHIECHLAGWIDSNPDSVTESELQSWIEQELIVYHGHIDDVRPVIKDCHVYVLPSYREGVPRTVLEAMAMGRAIITTDTPGCRETVVEGDNGHLVPVQNVQLLAEVMRSFVISPDKIDVMGEASYQMVKEKFEVSRVNQTMLGHMGISGE